MHYENKHGKEINITIPADYPLSPKVREFVISFLKNEGKFSSIWIWRLALMVDEMVNNAIEHGSNWWDDTIDVSIISFNDGSVKIIVKDSWKDGNKITAKELTKQIDLRTKSIKSSKSNKHSVRGRWLSHIVSVLSDDFSYEDNEKWWLTWTIFKKYDDCCSEEDEKWVSENIKKIKVETITL